MHKQDRTRWSRKGLIGGQKAIKPFRAPIVFCISRGKAVWYGLCENKYKVKHNKGKMERTHTEKARE